MHHKSKRFKHLEKRATRFVLNFSSYLVEKETDTFGHSLRTSSDDPSDKFCVNITFSYQELNIEKTGRVRTSWLLQTLKEAFETTGTVEEYDYDYDKPEHQHFVLQNAMDHQGVFA